MFKLKDNFKSFSENSLPYSFSVERHTETENLHILTDEEGFSLGSVGNRFILNTPAFSVGVFEASFKVTFPKEFDPVFYVMLQYNPQSRCGKALKIRCDLKENCPFVSLCDVSGEVFTSGKEIRLDGVSVNDEQFIKLKITINETMLVCDIEGRRAEFEYKTTLGKLAIERANFIGELKFSEIIFETDEEYEKKEIVAPKEVTIPLTNGGDIPYRFKYGVFEIEKELYFNAEIDGGTKTRTLNREDRAGQYVAERDFMTEPYIGISGGDNENLIFKIYNGVLGFIDPNIFWECLKQYFNDTEIPFRVCVKLDIKALPDDVEFIFGYKNLMCTGYGSQTGASEFRFDKNGNMTYSGAPINGSNIGEIRSPHDKKVISLLPCDIYKYEEVKSHFENNHYFLFDEKIKFKLDFKTRINPRFLSAKAYLWDIYESEILFEEVTVMSVSDWRKGYSSIEFAVEFPNINIGVYKVNFNVYYGDDIIETYKNTFEVFSPESEISPIEASGLPFVFSMNNEQKWLRRNSFDPWNFKKSCDVEHYISCVMATPVESLEKREWIPAHILKRKYFCWLAPRTCRNFLSEEYNEIKKNADYLFYGVPQSQNFHPLSAGSIMPFRADHWNYTNINSGISAEVIGRFMKENPAIAIETGYKEGEVLQFEVFEALMKKHGREWIDYANEHIAEIFAKQNRELCEYNPKVKRAAYGPISVYVTPTLSYRSVKSYGLPCDSRLSDEIYTGFSIFEDYPYSCSYQTYRAPFTLMTILLHCPDLVMYPEQYKGGMGGCIDGAVKFAHAPMGKYSVDVSDVATQSFEYVFNTAYKTADGFRYWNTYGFHRPDFKEELLNGLVNSWKHVIDYKPRKPLKSIAFLAEFDECDTRYTFPSVSEDRKRCVITNKSENGAGLIWECSREAGLPCGFGLKFDALSTLSSEECDVLVIPSLKNADEKYVSEIKRLYNEGVNLIALSSVDGLEDVFKVEKCEVTANINTAMFEGRSEHILPCDAHFEYKENGAETLLSANGYPAIMKTDRTFLVNTDVLNLGNSNAPQFNPSGFNHFVGVLMREAIESEITRLSSPLAKGENIGVTLFETEKGQKVLLAIDYTPFDNKEHGIKEAVVKLNLSGVKAVKSDKKVFCGKLDGKISELRFNIKPHESVFIELLYECSYL